ncbi:MAG: hypothetical protein ACO1SX_26455 [Actinomycetota bacterium]
MHRLNPIRLATGVALLLAAVPVTPAAAQAVSFNSKSASLEEVTTQLARQTGYAFMVSAGREAESLRHPIQWKDLQLANAIAELARTFKCEFFSIDSSGFYVIPTSKPEGKEVAVGPYMLRYGGPAGEEGEAGALRLTLMFTAPDDQRMEAIAGLGPDLRVVDNFGRLMSEPMPAGIQGTNAIRVRLTEYWQRLQLNQKDTNAVRIRALSGSLILYRKVTPVRVEIPIDPEKLPGEATQQGLTFRLEKVSQSGKELSAITRISWPESVRVMGRGISRTPLPYLVDENGRVYRDVMGGQPRQGAGEAGWEQRVRFEDLAAKPVKLVYDLLAKEQPDQSVPFRITSIPLPARTSIRFKPEHRPFYAAEGGAVSFSLVDKSGQPVEGEVSLGLSRKTASGWSGARWIELISEADGSVKVGHIEPGVYRVSRSFRFDPQSRRIEAPGPPLEVTIAAKTEAKLATFRLPRAAPTEPGR